MTEIQKLRNEKAVAEHDFALKEYEQNWRNCKSKRLRTCSATVFETQHYYLLMSYATIVACIDKNSLICYDYLRYLYGYTATSAQHIRKFMEDYGAVSKVTWHD